MLIILFCSKAGSGVMSIDYLGQTFKGDLLPNGQIKSQETGLFFKNPSAWAIYCKKIVNPSKKSGCGWASVKYKGRKMDHFKAVWSSKMKATKLTESVQRPDMDEGNSNSSEIEVIQEIRYIKVPLSNISTSHIPNLHLYKIRRLDSILFIYLGVEIVIQHWPLQCHLYQEDP